MRMRYDDARPVGMTGVGVGGLPRANIFPIIIVIITIWGPKTKRGLAKENCGLLILSHSYYATGPLVTDTKICRSMEADGAGTQK